MRSLPLPALLGLALVAVGCVHARPAEPGPGPLLPEAEAPPVVRVGDPVGLHLADRAERYLEHDRGLVRRDCSGLVETVFTEVGVTLPFDDGIRSNAVAREYRGFERERALVTDHPLPGDLAFFHDTYDRNHNGRLDDPLTHVAMVTEVGDDGTLTLVHFGSHGVASFKMNLEHPAEASDPFGRRINDRLRVQKRRDPPHTPYLASELFIAFGRPPDRPAAVANR